MRFTLTPEQESWQREVHEFLDDHATDELVTEWWSTGGMFGGPKERAFRRSVIDRGWYGLTWPIDLGGLGKSAVEQLLLIEEFEYRGVPSLPMTVTSLGQTIAASGTPANRAAWLPRIISGEVTLALGYSEPDAGTDLASLQTRAVLDGDEWVISGQKIWNSEGHRSTHEWLAVRTDPGAPKHAGISVIIVPIDGPGIEIQPLWTWGDYRTNQIFFDEVRVPKDNLIGEVNKGWQYIRTALELERSGIGAWIGRLRRAYDSVVAFVQQTVVDGERLANRPDVRLRLGELAVDLEVARLFTVRTASQMDEGRLDAVSASMQKIFVTELMAKIGDWGTEIEGLFGQLNKHDPLAPGRGLAEAMYREAPYLRFGGGTNEVLRSIVAQREFQLPR